MAQREQASVRSTDLLDGQHLIEAGIDPMTTVLLSDTDPRGPKAVAIATDAGQWLKCRLADGRKAYGIRSSEGDRYYLTTRTWCTCPARMHRPAEDCKHMLAVQLHVELMAEFTKPEVVEKPSRTAGLDRILSKRRPAYAHTTASKYDDIFKRFDDDGPRSVRKEDYL